ncbi:MAG: hypothetical protein CTY38_07835 [Methylotenera sp.]|uniref:FkbM family methyltransferase n=1 Tax=Methylotenera sp. TaxID=2051956 RepID=UPI000D4E4D14|nr:FkbM family methyltransferase [Methylotenera sp.]PPC81863.1 MAG: hypothetical protein CTY38_07835 [Methylotenera sp.]
MNFQVAICLPDLLRGTRAFPEGFFDLIREPILQGCGLDIGYPPESKKASGLLPGFDLDYFRSLVYGEITDPVDAWLTSYYTLPDGAAEYLKQYLPSECLILSFEMPPWLSQACIAWNIPFIDIRPSPLRFGRDLYIALKTNDSTIHERISQYAILNEELRLEASYLAASINMHQQRLNESDRYKFSLDNCLVFVGQAPYDASLITEKGKSLRCSDFSEQIRALASTRKLLHKPHPFAPWAADEERKSLEEITGQTVEPCYQNAYQILSCEDDVELLGISSGLLQEAAWFGKSSYQLFRPFVPLTKEGLFSGSDYQQIHFHRWLSPSFWHLILTPQKTPPRLAEITSLAHHHARQTFDQWWDYGKVITWEKSLAIESFERSGGIALRQRIEELENQHSMIIRGKNDYISFSDIEGMILTSGHASFVIAGYEIKFDLSNRHERAYAVRQLLNVRHPQSDIDKFIFQRFLRDSDSVLDAGANIGVTALECLESGAGKVLAVEALPALYERLCKLRSHRIVPISCAISSSIGQSDLFISTSHNQGSSLNPEMIGIFPTVFGKNIQKVQVQLTTIDHLSDQFGAFDVWKLDIEGGEVDALKGATRTLKSCPPRIIIAELYDLFYDEFCSIIKFTHPYAYRAFISLEYYKLEILPVVKGLPKGVHHTSPMYIFSRTPLLN